MEFVSPSRVQFTFASREEIRKSISKVCVTSPSNNVVFGANHTLFDTRMGAFRNIPCGTCGYYSDKCDGHFGSIALASPCLNPNFEEPLLVEILRTFCYKCAHTCECARVQRCRYTGRKENMCGLKFVYMVHEERITLRDLYDFIARIPREVYLEVAAFSHLRNLRNLTEAVFIHDLLVLPIPNRPPTLSDGMWRPDGITRLYATVLQKNTQLEMKKGVAHGTLLEEYHNELQSSVDILFSVTNTTKDIKSKVYMEGGIRQRLDGKYGRLRQNLMGKRVEFSARSVLSGDPNLGLNEVGVPRTIAENLTIPVRVTQHNAHTMHRMHIKYLHKQDGKKIDTSFIKDYKLEIGDVVERSLMNGDIVVVNRQPSLHRGSMLACYVRVFDCSTFRLNYSSMITLNADCDGDELNMHVPQDLASRAELEELMLASVNIVSSQSSAPLVGCSQDSLLGCYLASHDLLTLHELQDILFKADLPVDEDHQPHIFKPGRPALYTGKILFEIALRAAGLAQGTYEIEEDAQKDELCASFFIRRGTFVHGVLTKKIIGAAEGGLVHHVFLQKGHLAASRFIHTLQKIAGAYLDIRGFSVGVSDCCVDTHALNFDALESTLRAHFLHGRPEDEGELLAALGELTKLAPRCDERDNRLLQMINSGAKGSILNFNQITTCVGQQIEENGRVSKRFRDRTLPHYTKFDPSARSQGLVASSFIGGLRPDEFFFHAMGGRIGILDTVLKTSVTGHQHRKLVKVLESIIVQDAGARARPVIDQSTGDLVQFEYGEDAYDGTFLKRRKIR